MSCGDISGALLILFMLWVSFNLGYENGCRDMERDFEDAGLEREEP